MSVSKRECLNRIRELDTERRRLLAVVERLQAENSAYRSAGAELWWQARQECRHPNDSSASRAQAFVDIDQKAAEILKDMP